MGRHRGLCLCGNIEPGRLSQGKPEGSQEGIQEGVSSLKSPAMVQQQVAPSDGKVLRAIYRPLPFHLKL